MGQAKFLIIDGSSLVYRAFFALPLLQTRDGVYTNAVYGFTSMVLKLLSEEKPGYAVVAFDKAAPTFRHLAYEEYKAKREKAPDELKGQIGAVHAVLSALGIPVLDKEGYEADDIIGTLCKKAVSLGLKPVIVSGDADVFQLVDMPAEVIYTRKGISDTVRYDGEKLRERFGLSARQYIDLKALKGDPSDNIPGVPGVGEKTAIKLLTEYGSLEAIFEHVGDLKGKLRDTMEANREKAFLSRELATIVTDVPLDFNPEDYKVKNPDREALRKIFERLEFRSLLEKLSAPEEKKPEDVVFEGSTAVTGGESLQHFARELEKAAHFAVFWAGGPEKTLVFALPEQTFSVPHESLGNEAIKRLLLGGGRTAVVGDSKSWYDVLSGLNGALPEGDVFDVNLAAYLLDPLQSSYTPEKLAEVYLGRSLPAPPGKKDSKPDWAPYACAASRALFDLFTVLKGELAQNSLESLYNEMELPLTRILWKMERHGVALDLAELARLREITRERIAELEREIHALAEEPFNLNSPKQLAHVLFEKLGLPALKKTKTGYSTDAEVLEELAGRHEIVAKILEHRMLVKLHGTYLEGLSKLVNPVTGRIHTHFNQTVTATGRLSSSEPNLQNIPIRLEEGRRIRRAFIPSAPNRVLLSADYSQIELRILAHLSQDEVLIRSFRAEEDIHRRTAAEVFGIAPEEVTPRQRDSAKAVNFGIIYGISDYGLSRQLGISRQEAKTYIQRYLERYPGVQEYFKNVIEEARRKGYVTTMFNRRRRLPDINSKNFMKRSFAERTALNTPIQGSAADIIKMAMLKTDVLLQEYGEKAAMILQVHDELLFDIREDLLFELAPRIKEAMESVAKLVVPLTVDMKWGRNWAEMEKMTW